MQQFVLLFLLLQLYQLLLQHLLKTADQLLVVSLDLGDLALCFLQHFVLDLVAVALHGDGEPLLKAGFECACVLVLLGALLHLAQVLVLVAVLLPSVEEGLLVVLCVEEGREVLDLVTLLLHLRQGLRTLRLRMQ